MSPGEYVVWLVQHGCGWLGWSEAQVLDTDMTIVALAIEGRSEMLQAMNPWGVSSAAEVEKPKPTGAEILSFAQAHNRLRRSGMMRAAG